MGHPLNYPRRIVCLTDETTEVLYLLGEQDRIVGVSGYVTRPPEARKKPRVSAFRNARIDAILGLKPDLVLTFSDVQAEITRDLILRGVATESNRASVEFCSRMDLVRRWPGSLQAGGEMTRGHAARVAWPLTRCASHRTV